jgi:hypothetical protein
MTASVFELGERRVVDIDAVRPYWRNPRMVTEEDVAQLVASLKRFGYQQPIVVDTDFVIIVGHTRYAAMRRMDVTRVEVVIADMPAKDARQYRLLDNKVGELTYWNYDLLVEEIGTFDRGIASLFFPELSDSQVQSFVTPQAEAAQQWDLVVPEADLVCPHCWHSFAVRVSRDEVFDGTIDPRKSQEASA